MIKSRDSKRDLKTFCTEEGEEKKDCAVYFRPSTVECPALTALLHFLEKKNEIAGWTVLLQILRVTFL